MSAVIVESPLCSSPSSHSRYPCDGAGESRPWRQADRSDTWSTTCGSCRRLARGARRAPSLWRPDPAQPGARPLRDAARASSSPRLPIPDRGPSPRADEPLLGATATDRWRSPLTSADGLRPRDSEACRRRCRTPTRDPASTMSRETSINRRKTARQLGKSTGDKSSSRQAPSSCTSCCRLSSGVVRAAVKRKRCSAFQLFVRRKCM